MLAHISGIAVLAVAIMAGLDKLSFWWILLPVFLAASFSISSGPGFDLVMQASREGRPGVFPKMLGCHFVVMLAFGAAIFGITKALA